jgi:hypothetical protein
VVGQVKYAFTKRGLCLTPPANWADIIRQAAPPHYEVLPSTDVHEVVTLRALCNAEPDATLVLEPCAKFPQLTVAEVIADVQDVLRRAQGLGRWGEDTPFWWHYAKLLPAVRRPPWEFCRDAVLAAAVPHWEASVCEAERRVAFHPREQPQ